DRRDAAHRAGPLRPRRSGRKVLPRFRQAFGVRILRPGDRRLPAQALEHAGHGAAPAHPHASGLGYPFTSAILRDFKPRAGETYPVGPLLFEPGTRRHYGTSTDWLGRLVEKISGMPLEDYFRQKIFTPLNMADTSYFVPKDKEARLVTVN